MNLSWIKYVFSLSLRKVFAYRADFWINFIATIVGEVGVAYFLWQAVYKIRAQETLSGYTFPTMVLYFVIVSLIGKVIRGPEISFVSIDIYDGSLSRYLVYPISFLLYKFVGFLSNSFVALIQMVACLIFYFCVFGMPTGIVLTPLSIFYALLMINAALIYYFVTASVIEMFAFWFDNLWSVIVMFNLITYFAGGGIVPLELFPEWFRNGIAYTPFPYLLAVPVKFVMGMGSLQDLVRGILVLGAWLGLSIMLIRVVWRRGLKQYTGVGQ